MKAVFRPAMHSDVSQKHASPDAAAQSLQVFGFYPCATGLALLIAPALALRKRNWNGLLKATLAVLCGAAAAGVQATALPFSATVAGTSTIAEVLNPVGPVVRAETLATGSGTPGVLTYHSVDVLNLTTGQGSGHNRFVTAAGDELLGRFVVQLVPGADPTLFDLIGEVTFEGGLGLYAGASGNAAFVATGQFISASVALTRFVFQGTVNTVAEPPTSLLLLCAGGAAVLALRKQAAGAPARGCSFAAQT